MASAISKKILSIILFEKQISGLSIFILEQTQDKNYSDRMLS